ncbi:MAG: hypothetical protein GY859_07915, partial [Desulfobacterales bacterium]|nr:hypothetical protein [Desulfobacterales bacterium]
DLKVMRALEKIPAFQPPLTGDIEEKLRALVQKLFTCPTPSKSSVEKQLRREPYHECGLRLEHAGEAAALPRRLAREAFRIVERGMDARMNVFLTPTIRERLAKGESEPLIRKIMACDDVKGLRETLVDACVKDPTAADVIERYVTRVSVKTVNLGDFSPSANPVDRDGISALADEFRLFLEKAVEDMEEEEGSVSMIRLETLVEGRSLL